MDPVNDVGLNPDRTLEVPAPGPLYDQAAWYRGSPTLGRVGPSVILGHVDSTAGGPSVFYDLGRLRPGEAITVTLADRSVRTFAVDTVRRVDSAARSYEDNTVVFARLVP